MQEEYAYNQSDHSTKYHKIYNKWSEGVLC
jgi:hypothetical protein